MGARLFVRGVICLTCGARAGAKCRRAKDGAEVGWYHTARHVLAYKRLPG